MMPAILPALFKDDTLTDGETILPSAFVITWLTGPALLPAVIQGTVHSLSAEEQELERRLGPEGWQDCTIRGTVELHDCTCLTDFWVWRALLLLSAQGDGVMLDWSEGCLWCSPSPLPQHRFAFATPTEKGKA